MSLVSKAFGTKVAVVALSLVMVGGGVAVASASAGSENGPEAAQKNESPSPSAAEEPTIGEDVDAEVDPAVDPTETPSDPEAKGPDATGPAAFGLCTAYTAGGLNSTSVAFEALSTAAESAGGVTEYCEPVLEAHAESKGGGSSEPETPESDEPSIQNAPGGTDEGAPGKSERRGGSAGPRGR